MEWHWLRRQSTEKDYLDPVASLVNWHWSLTAAILFIKHIKSEKGTIWPKLQWIAYCISAANAVTRIVTRSSFVCCQSFRFFSPLRMLHWASVISFLSLSDSTIVLSPASFAAVIIVFTSTIPARLARWWNFLAFCSTGFGVALFGWRFSLCRTLFCIWTCQPAYLTHEQRIGACRTYSSKELSVELSAEAKSMLNQRTNSPATASFPQSTKCA